MTTLDARTALRLMVLIGTPLLLGALEVFHPLGEDFLTDLGPRVDWFITLHVLQLPLFGLMAVAVWLLGAGAQGRTLTANWIGAWLFAIFYPAFDAIGGIATGMAVKMALGAPPEAQLALVALASEFSFSSITLACSVIGGLGFMMAGSAAAVSLARRGAPRGALICLVLGTLLFGLNHTPPFGPVGLLLFLGASAWLDLAPRVRGRPTRHIAVAAPAAAAVAPPA
jgi:hypothetical protein